MRPEDRRTPRLAAGLLLVGAVVGAWPAAAALASEDPAPQTAPTPALEARFAALFEKFSSATNKFWSDFQSEPDQQKRRELYEKRPGREFLADFKALAADAKGTEVAARSWMQVATISADFDLTEDLTHAVDTLVADHVASRNILELPGMVGQMEYALGQERVVKSLQALLDKSPHKEIKAATLYALGQHYLGQEDAALAPKARECFTRLASEFGGLRSPSGKNYKALTEGFLFELDHLQIGQTAPDFEVVDENGVKFKLSDYRGKVVVIDFWGYW